MMPPHMMMPPMYPHAYPQGMMPVVTPMPGARPIANFIVLCTSSYYICLSPLSNDSEERVNSLARRSAPLGLFPIDSRNWWRAV
jgi:hypothetical protein